MTNGETQYDFSEFLNDKSDVLDHFIDKFTSCVVGYDDDDRAEIMVNQYKKIIDILNISFVEKDLINLFEELAEFKISLDIPYALVTNEIYGLKHILISKMANHSIDTNIIDFVSLFNKINNRVAKLYLLSYIENLLSVNSLRLSSIADLIEKNIITHYESHLLWLNELAKCIQEERTDNFPQLNSNLCAFGSWLVNDGKVLIQNNSKYKIIDHLHINLHLLAKKIFSHLKTDEYHVLITYLEKCEFISLSIGTELALIDNVLMNKRVTKDTLTGALNRNGLNNVFESQYELSLATNNPFILAMCDLDFFKNINDTYGHVAGDKMLESFVNVVKENIRNSDIIIRYGGEEFVILLPVINSKKGFEVLEAIRKNFENYTLKFDSHLLKATVSIGMIEIHPQHSYKQSFAEQYIMMADKQLYSAKENGRNRIEVHEYYNKSL